MAEAKAAFAKADRALNEAWMAMKKAVPEKIFTELKAQQRALDRITRPAALEASPTPKDAAEAKQSAAYWQTAASLTEARAQWLRRLADNEDDPLTGLWTDGNGGTLEIVERKDKLFFVFHVVRGRGLHVGVIAGVAQWNTTSWLVQRQGPGGGQAGGDQPLPSSRRSGHLEVIGANTSHYHGARAYFDGEYYKIGPLEDKVQENVVKAGETGEVPEE